MSAPLCIDLFCGLGGWTEGFLAEGYDVIGFDIERHVYGEHRYPAQLVLQDVRTLHGSQFCDATIIVASSPCQEFSYRAMPWKRAKALGPPELGMELFAQAARIQREACEAAGRYIPMIQENVRGAQPWVGRAQWHYGSYYLWGDVPALMPIPSRGVKVGGLDWSKYGEPDYKGHAFNTSAERETKNAGGSWFGAAHGSKSTARKAASARIAKIPFPLARYIAQVARATYQERAACPPSSGGSGYLSGEAGLAALGLLAFEQLAGADVEHVAQRGEQAHVQEESSGPNRSQSNA